MTDNEIMSLEKAMFILRHGSAESIYKYFEAINIIEKEINRQKAEIERLEINLEEAHIDIKEHLAEIERLEMDNAQLQSNIINANMNCDHLLAEVEK